MNSQLSPKVALVTGASSGFGLLTTLELARKGWNVLATMRDLDRRTRLEAAAAEVGVTEQLEIRQLDITDFEAIPQVMASAVQDFGRIDALINNAGFAMAGFAEDLSLTELREQFETNFFAHVAVTRAALPFLRHQGSGHIVFVSSISGRMGFPGIGAYAASKHAIEGYAESLRLETHALGLRVVLVEPGSYNTGIWARGAHVAEAMKSPESPNHERALKMREQVQESPKADPTEVARLIADVCEQPNPRLRYLVGRDAKLAFALKCLLPWRTFEKMIARHANPKH